jgi:hypothetical protein
LPIGRYDLVQGSRGSQPDPAGVGRASGNIRATIQLMPLWFFRRARTYQKKIPAAISVGEDIVLLRQAIPLWPPARYTQGTNFIAT